MDAPAIPGVDRGRVFVIGISKACSPGIGKILPVGQEDSPLFPTGEELIVILGFGA